MSRGVCPAPSSSAPEGSRVTKVCTARGPQGGWGSAHGALGLEGLPFSNSHQGRAAHRPAAALRRPRPALWHSPPLRPDTRTAVPFCKVLVVRCDAAGSHDKTCFPCNSPSLFPPPSSCFFGSPGLECLFLPNHLPHFILMKPTSPAFNPASWGAGQARNHDVF